MRIVTATLILATLSGVARSQRAIVLSKPGAEYAGTFSEILGARPLRDGRLIVSDSREKTVQLIDFAGTAMPIGRTGRGPGEWMLPSGVAPLPGDSTALWDPGNRRFLRIRPDGTPADDFRPEQMNFGPMATMFPRGADARGNIYFQGSPFTTVNGQAAVAESIAVLRYDRARGLVDTVAFIHPQKGNARLASDPSGRGGFANGLANPLLPLDDFAVLPSGRIAVLRGAEYRMDIYEDRVVKMTGPRVAYTPTPVDAAIKEAVLDERKRQLVSSAPRSRPDGTASPVIPDALKRFLDIEPWPAVMPPFMRGAPITRVTPGASQVWVLRATYKAGDPSRYDVFDESGRIIATVQLPARTRILAFNGQSVFALHIDDDDLQHLQRFQLPAF